MNTTPTNNKTKLRLCMAGITSASFSAAGVCWWLIKTGTVSPSTLGRGFIADGVIASTWTAAIFLTITSTNLMAQVGVGIYASFWLPEENTKEIETRLSNTFTRHKKSEA